MSKPEIKAVDAETKLPTISLTKILTGFDGKAIQVRDVDEDGKETRFDMSLRWAIIASLKTGMAEEGKALSEPDKIRCHILGHAVCDERNTGHTFKPEDIVLIKKLANTRFAGPELYGAFLELFDPTALEK